jgi:hypothetical protein
MQELFLKSKEEFQRLNNTNNQRQESEQKEQDVNAIKKEDAEKQSLSTEDKAKVAIELIKKAKVEYQEGDLGQGQIYEKEAMKIAESLPVDRKVLSDEKSFSNDDSALSTFDHLNAKIEELSKVDKQDAQQSQTQSLKVYPLLVKHGHAPFQHKEGESDSYYMELSNGVTKWGKGLEEAIQKSQAKIGDAIDAKAVGERDVVVDVDIKDKDGRVVGVKKEEVKRIDWEVTVVDVQKNRFTTSYDWNNDEQKLKFTVNGDSASKIPDETLQKIMAKDKFLKAFSLDEVKSGMLDMKKAESRAVGKTFNADGDVVVNQQKVSNVRKASQ